jgi:UDPglucose--hexose-1-phosphate uridylyltransferase
MDRRTLAKPDGRELHLYASRPMQDVRPAPTPSDAPRGGSPHLRWHPLRGEWVTYATYRQDRTFLPPPEYSPLAVTTDPAQPTELPAGDWEIAVFDNRYPALALDAAEPPRTIVPTAAGIGKCEVVVFTQDRNASLGALPQARIELLLAVWAERCTALADAGLQYVLPFENRGAEVGVTLHHPHGQIYGYPTVPPVPARMQAIAATWHAETGRALLTDMIGDEERSGERMLYAGEHAVAFVPACARYPYEVWVAPRRTLGRFADLTPEERADLARALKSVLLRYDGLWSRPFPYLMAWYPAPTDGAHPEWHLHAEFFPPYRTRDRLKYLAGTELGAGFFAMDALPEDKARELRAVEIPSW